MNDIVWDVEQRDISFGPDGLAGDFLLTTNPSTQNGGILLEARCMNILQCQFGIGFNSQVLGGNTAGAAFQMNRWVQQIFSDGATGSWQPLPPVENVQFNFAAECNYLNS